ncbi:MAG: MBL fold metallo-hydrolase [Hyphomicrobiales bacterium]|nr:MAG: MBL fold metallo-hydrolase [Hyphomicrobiales bacterium]
MSIRSFFLTVLILMAASLPARGFELQTLRIADNVYALVGGLSMRSYDNHALNSTSGFIVTPEGVVLIDPGASAKGAALIERTIGAVTAKPVRWVINSGAQDHRWLGNGYFASRGARIIALARTVKEQKLRAAIHLARLTPILKDRLDGTEPVTAPEPLPGDRATLELGGRKLELIWPGPAHFAGDAVIWLADQRILFTGDLVFLERMLGVLPFSNAPKWLQSFQIVEQLQPEKIVPGHGHPGSLEDARRDTEAYLKWLVGHVRPEVENWTPLEEVVEKLKDAPFKFLRNYDLLHKMNVNRTYLQIEAGG